MGRGSQPAQDFIQCAECWDPATRGQPKPGCVPLLAPSHSRRPSSPQPQSTFPSWAKGRGEDEGSLVTGALTWGFHLGLKTL